MYRISAIIPTHERNNLLFNTIKLLKNQIIKNIKLDIIVVIDEEIQKSIKTHKKINNFFDDIHTLIGNGNWWYTKSINEGVKYAKRLKADYILTLNDDMKFDIKFIQTLFDAQKNSNDQTIIGAISVTQEIKPRITFSGVKKYISWRSKQINYIKKFTVVEPKKLSGVYQSPILYGRGILIPVSIFDEFGYYDESFIQYNSETDFTLRMYKAGKKVMVCYDAVVYEYLEETSKGALYNDPSLKEYLYSIFDRTSINSIYTTYLFYKKHGIKSLLPVYLPYTFFKKLLLYFQKYLVW